MKVVHLPCYDDNPYQGLLFDALKLEGITPIDGGGGGNFLRSILLRWKPEAVHFHWLHPYVLRETRLASWLRSIRFLFEVAIIRLSGKRIVWTVHNLTNHEGKFPDIELFACRLMGWLSDGILCHSNYAADQASNAYQIPREKFTVTFHPSFIENYPEVPRQSIEEIRQYLELEPARLTFLFLGRVAPYKGIEALIEAFDSLNCDDIQLVIAGNPVNEYASVLNELARDKTHVNLRLNYIPDEQIPLYFAATDVVVLPFQQILTSSSLLLGMSFGRVCIVPKLGGLPEVLPESQHKFMFDPNLSNDLIRVMQIAVDFREQLTTLGKENFKRAKGWTWRDLARACAELYR